MIHVKIISDTPVNIFIEDAEDTLIHSNNFSVENMFTPGALIIVINNNSRSATVGVQLSHKETSK
jgi:hypothetical protein